MRATTPCALGIVGSALADAFSSPPLNRTASAKADPTKPPTDQIFVKLLDEGLNVYRPIQAEKVANDIYRIPPNLDPGQLGEEWEFPRGATVVCRPRDTSDGKILAAVRLARAAG